MHWQPRSLNGKWIPWFRGLMWQWHQYPLRKVNVPGKALDLTLEKDFGVGHMVPGYPSLFLECAPWLEKGPVSQIPKVTPEQSMDSIWQGGSLLINHLLPVEQWDLQALTPRASWVACWTPPAPVPSLESQDEQAFLGGFPGTPLSPQGSSLGECC